MHGAANATIIICFEYTRNAVSLDDTANRLKLRRADLAHLGEQRPCNAQVVRSSRIVGTIGKDGPSVVLEAFNDYGFMRSIKTTTANKTARIFQTLTDRPAAR